MSQQLLERGTAPTKQSPGPLAFKRLPKPKPKEWQEPETVDQQPETPPELDRPAAAPSPPDPRSRRAESERLALRLADTFDLVDRIAIYNEVGVRALSRAAAVCPDLMPEANGEFEWIALTMADLD